MKGSADFFGDPALSEQLGWAESNHVEASKRPLAGKEASAVTKHALASRSIVNQMRANFIRTELDLALTFCQVAFTTPKNSTAARNLEHAEKARAAAMHYLQEDQVSREEQKEIGEKLAELDDSLRLLRRRKCPDRNPSRVTNE